MGANNRWENNSSILTVHLVDEQMWTANQPDASRRSVFGLHQETAATMPPGGPLASSATPQFHCGIQTAQNASRDGGASGAAHPSKNWTGTAVTG